MVVANKVHHGSYDVVLVGLLYPDFGPYVWTMMVHGTFG